MNGRWTEIMGRYADGAATAEEVRELDTAMRADPALRRTFLRYMAVDSALAGAATGLSVLKSGTSKVTAKSTVLRSWVAITAIAAAIMILASVLVLQKGIRAGSQPPAFATLAAANDAVWADPNVELALRAGELPAGPIRLEAGTAEFQFVDGATLILRGQASVRIAERKRVFVDSGRVFCRCPSPESRLSIETAATEIVDLGTEFTVEARPDKSTLVAVLSGEVRVGRQQTRLLRKGEAVEVRGDGILAITPLAREDISELLLSSPAAGEAVKNGQNLLKDAGFEGALSDSTWSGTEPNLTHAPGRGRTGAAIRIDGNSAAHWPQGRQKLQTGDIAGKLVIATVWGTPAEKLLSRQNALLKIVFVNEQGRDFAFAMRRFLGASSTPGVFTEAQVAAFAPPGTRQVQVQLMFQSNLRESGAVLFDDASLVIADAP